MHEESNRTAVGRRVLMLGLAAAAGIGIARFAYSLILPDLRANLGWGYSQAGLLNTLNALGYLFGAVATPGIVRRVGPARAIQAGVVLIVLGMAAMLAPPTMAGFALSRIASGVGAALAFIAGATLGASLADGNASRRATVIGLFYIGPGLGMALSGSTAPFVLEHFGAGSWRIAWAWLTLVAGALAVPAVRASAGARHGATAATQRAELRALAIAPLLLGYALFGVGAIAYMTFVIAWVKTAGGGPLLQAEFWTIIGIASIASPWLWGRLMGRLRGGLATAIVTGVTGAGAALPLWLGANAVVLLASAVLFGSAVFAVVAATTVFVRRNYPQGAWAAGITVLTVAFGIGQTLGPIATGFVTDASGGRLESGLWFAVLCLAAGVAACAAQRDLTHARLQVAAA
ncbi:MAG TPA: YbfB/YjiJ family MFS transporter [Usitatibacter sp.]|nr:YbfB/YjiJ family MFS transporter [Usitatibacter sp.]